MTANEDIAVFLAYSITHDLLPPETAIQWADRLILGSAAPETMTPLSLAKDKKAVLEALHDFSKKELGGENLDLVLSLIRKKWRAGELSIKSICDLAWNLHFKYILKPVAPGYADWGVTLGVQYDDNFKPGHISEAEMRAFIDDYITKFTPDTPLKIKNVDV